LQPQKKIKEIGNAHFKNKEFILALDKYRKAQAYLEPLLHEQHIDKFGEEEPTTWMAGGQRPKDRTDIIRIDFTIKLNVCQCFIAIKEWRAAIAMADNVILDLVGKFSKKGNGALPNDPLTTKALYRRAKARVGLSDVDGEVSQLEEALEDLQKALTVDPNNKEIKTEIEKVKIRQKQADLRGKHVYQNMVQGASV